MKSLMKFLTAFILFLLVACNGGGDAVPTTAQQAATPILDDTNTLPATTDIATPQPQQPLDATLTLESIEIQSDTIITGDDFLPIDNILNEIDDEVCQDAYETKWEIEALIEEGADLAELESAVDELIKELENCPTPTP
jgi:hypothetical protein